MTDEQKLICRSCGATEFPDGLTTAGGHVVKGSVDDHCGPVEAAASTDEGEARATIKHRSRLGTLWELSDGGTCITPSSVEAAIRAPLEERIRELEADYVALSNFCEKHDDEVEMAGSFRAENERLREALRDYVTANRAIAEQGRTVERVDAENEAWMRLLDFVATPPSSTAGTE